MARTFARATVYLTDGSTTPVLIGMADRMAARQKFGYQLDAEVDREQDEEWIAFVAWCAYKRALPDGPTFEKFLEVFIGYETDESPGEVAAPA